MPVISDRVAADYLQRLRSALLRYTQTADAQLPHNHTHRGLVGWYRLLGIRYEMASERLRAARVCADFSKDEGAVEEEILKIVPTGKIPHPNGYLSEQQRAVLVLLDKLEKEET